MAYAVLFGNEIFGELFSNERDALDERDRLVAAARERGTDDRYDWTEVFE